MSANNSVVDRKINGWKAKNILKMHIFILGQIIGPWKRVDVRLFEARSGITMHANAEPSIYELECEDIVMYQI